MDGLQEVVTYIDQNQQDDVENHAELDNYQNKEEQILEEAGISKDYTKLEFDDLNA